MSAIAYSVTATLPDEATAHEYIEWLEDGHIDRVIEGGAHSGMIVRMVDPATPIRVETRYIFSNQARFDEYLRTAAPALRADGLKRFPPSRGITFERRVGVVL